MPPPRTCFPQFVIMKSRDNVEEYVRVLSSAAVEFENVLGIYVLEDWGWAHWGGWQNPEDESFARPAMSNVVLHTALSCTSSSGTIISHIDVTPVSAYVYRGPAQLGPEFAVESSYLARGKSFALL